MFKLFPWLYEYRIWCPWMMNIFKSFNHECIWRPLLCGKGFLSVIRDLNECMTLSLEIRHRKSAAWRPMRSQNPAFKDLNMFTFPAKTPTQNFKRWVLWNFILQNWKMPVTKPPNDWAIFLREFSKIVPSLAACNKIDCLFEISKYSYS